MGFFYFWRVKTEKGGEGGVGPARQAKLGSPPPPMGGFNHDPRRPQPSEPSSGDFLTNPGQDYTILYNCMQFYTIYTFCIIYNILYISI